MLIASTDRLELRELTLDDAPFILELLNDPDFIRNIADRKVRTLYDARGYLENTIFAAYRDNGFGLWMVESNAGREGMGICGLIRRPVLEDVDVGYAFLPKFRGRGFALEAVEATLGVARDRFELKRLAAIVNPDNEPSIRLLQRLGFRYRKMVQIVEGEPEIRMYTLELSSPPRRHEEPR